MADTFERTLFAAHLREQAANLLALLPAARRAAAGGPGGGEASLDGVARAAYRILRAAENMAAHAVLEGAPPAAAPLCVSSLARAFFNGAAGVCRAVSFSGSWPGAALWAAADARLFAAALGNLVCNGILYGGERPALFISAARRGNTVLLCVEDNGGGPPACARGGGGPREADGCGLGLVVARRFAEAYGGRLLWERTAAGGTRAALCMPACSPGADATPPDYVADRFSPLYVQLSPVCDLPL